MIDGPDRPDAPADWLRLAFGLPLVVVFALAGCSFKDTRPASSEPLIVFAAASLGDAMRAVGDAYVAAVGTNLVVSADSSTALRVQIEHGARADVFLSADVSNPATLAAAGLTDGNPVAFGMNALAIVVPADNPGKVTGPSDLARPGLKIIAAGDAVPISQYATTLLDRLAVLPGAPEDLPVRYAANVVSREDNVASVLAKIELGEGDAAIVYASDAGRSTSLIRIPIPEEAMVVATYGAVVLGPASGSSVAAGHAFLAWLTGPAGQAVLATFGFTTIP